MFRTLSCCCSVVSASAGATFVVVGTMGAPVDVALTIGLILSFIAKRNDFVVSSSAAVIDTAAVVVGAKVVLFVVVVVVVLDDGSGFVVVLTSAV